MKDKENHNKYRNIYQNRLCRELFLAFAHDHGSSLDHVISNLDFALSTSSDKRSNKNSELIEYSIKHLLSAKKNLHAISRCLFFQRQEHMHQNIEEIFESVIELVKCKARRLGVEIKLDIEPGGLTCDYSDMQILLLNLISNALESYPSEGAFYNNKSINIIANFSESELTIKVKDKGCGIDPLSSEQVFDPTYTTKENGDGFGLYLAKNIVESYGGKIYFKSIKNNGSVFYVIMPVNKEKIL